MTDYEEKLKTAQTKWYKKLKESGFDDIENEQNLLKQWDTSRYLSNRNGGKTGEQIVQANESKAEYYRLANGMLFDHTFGSNLDKLIWWYHSDGLSNREISDILSDLGIPGENTTSVHRAVARIKNIMLAKNNGTAE